MKFEAMLYDAIDKMEDTLIEGQETHPPDDWRELGVEGNLRRAADHLELAERADEAMWEEDHLAHAFVRLGMAVQLREEGKRDSTD